MAVRMTSAPMLGLLGAAYLLFDWIQSDKTVLDALELGVGAALACYSGWKAYCDWKMK